MSGSPLYEKLSAQLKDCAEEEYAKFHSALLKDDKIKVLGVHVPTLRKIAAGYVHCIDELLSIPDDYYEITFVKLQAAARLPYESFVEYADKCVSLIDNWATCDCFTPKCIAQNKADFYKYIRRYLCDGREFYQRFALTTLLHFYVGEEWADEIISCLTLADTQMYYVHMAAAWLTAEIIIKDFARGVEFLKSGALDKRTHNKAITKACESFRLSGDQKQYLKTLKR